MKIFIGSDHRGFKLKENLVSFLKRKKCKVFDLGSYSNQSSDYPLIAYDVAKKVAERKEDRGILICKTGIGSSITANKIPGIRAALCYNLKAARLCRQHNDANLLVLGNDFVNQNLAKRIVNIFLKTKFLGNLKGNERHVRRLKQIREIEKKLFKS